MRRICNHHISVGHGFHHAAPGHFYLNAADSGLYFWITIGLSLFILNLLLGHFQVLFVLPMLINIIQHGQNQHGQADKKAYFQ